MLTTELRSLDLPFKLKAHTAFNLSVDSPSLRGNPLGDPGVRHNYILAPNVLKKNSPLIFHLSGYFSTGFQNFQTKTLSKNFVEQIDRGVVEKKYPQAIHVFVEATTFWGGSQFINSPGCGDYANYILKDLYKAVSQHFTVSSQSKELCLMGGSSGGYGALSLVSEKNSPFGLAFAAAPDSFFQASLLPELFHAAPELNKYQSFAKIKKLIDVGELQNKKSFFNLANIIAMAHCYAPKESFKKDFMNFPINLQTGEINGKLWKQWLAKDPVHFIEKRKKHLADKEIHLDVGQYDNFSLQFGTRQVANILSKLKVKHRYTEFPGNHFGLSARKLLFLETLAKKWRKFV